MLENLLAEYLPDRVRFGALLDVSARNAFLGKKPNKPLIYQRYRGKRGLGWVGLEPTTNALKGHCITEKGCNSANKVPIESPCQPKERKLRNGAMRLQSGRSFDG